MALFSSHGNGHDINRDIEALRREVATLTRALSRQGRNAWRGAADEASGLYEDVAGRISEMMPVMRRRAYDLEETIRDNPGRTAAVAGLTVLAVAAAICVLGSSRR